MFCGKAFFLSGGVPGDTFNIEIRGRRESAGVGGVSRLAGRDGVSQFDVGLFITVSGLP